VVIDLSLTEREAEVVLRVLRAVAPVLDQADRNTVADVCSQIVVEVTVARLAQA
jgi:hypothetical protein